MQCSSASTLLYYTEQFKEAEEIFLEAIELLPDQESTYNNLGKIIKQLPYY